MEEEQKVLSLFDFYWFDRQILTQPLYFHSPEDSVPAEEEAPVDPSPEAAAEPPPRSEAPADDHEQPPPQVGRLRSLHHRSFSDQLNGKSDPFSPNSVLEVPKLDTILSGKEVCAPPAEVNEGGEEARKSTLKKTGRRLRKKRSSKSLSDLEFQELKGFMDLGFTFSEGDIDSNLISILPGLQRLGKKDGDHEITEKSTVSRPYLSEAWDVSREEYNPRGEEYKPDADYWKIATSAGDEDDMKNRLRVWAQAVASAVRS
ncbi:hypothetical protein H6P81_014334 [Aristolochia fimbriata]|uniref:Uncharacterized protein n=1 Tax=Aristolochia fimbriata TaxID=158543 RepID=A0AAV7EIF2_ARIFI|nr:hypothetical protein H6P81_014334 [Aristolochia fimbriata]